MAISDVCKFELKANVDRYEKENKISRRKAIAQLALDLGILEETARKKDYRARIELGQVVPTKSKARKPKMPSNLDRNINAIIKDVESLKYKLTKVNGFCGDIQSKKLQLAFKKELECLQGPIEKIFKEYQEAGEVFAEAQLQALEKTKEELQKDLDNWMDDYNTDRPHQGKCFQWKTPIATFLENVPLKINPGRKLRHQRRRFKSVASTKKKKILDMKFNTKRLSAKLRIIQHKLKYSLLSTTTRIILIIKNVMISYPYAFISFCNRANYWIDYTAYGISRASYTILKKKI
jgi:hypothetical protein